MFQLDGFRVWFRHEQVKDAYPVPGTSAHAKGFTECTILLGDDTAGYGVAHCSVKDNFERNEGRKHALANALKDACFNKEARTRFWEKYFSVIEHNRLMALERAMLDGLALETMDEA
jgi:hypothetical protein